MASASKAFVILAVLCSFGNTIEASDYAGFKVPPLPVSSTMTFEHRFIDLGDVSMAYVEAGAGDPIVFLHGVPTSSYLWRNVMPHLEPHGRVIAPDMVGFGKSDQPDIEHSFDEHYQHLSSFIEAKKLNNITLVMHDWGSAFGLHYARLHPGRIKALVTMESILAPVMPAPGLDTLSAGSANFFRNVRAPVSGEDLVLEDNYLIERALPNAIVRTLDSDALDTYRRPFAKKQTRVPLHRLPNQMPIGQHPESTYKIVTDYNRWLEETPLPWLFLYASPGTLNPPRSADYWADRAQNIETVYIGRGLHFVQEDQPYAIGRSIADWYRRLPASE